MSRILFLLVVVIHSLCAFTVTDDFEVVMIENVGYSWESVSFENSYTAAPIVVCTLNLSSASDSDAVVRIDNLTTSGFSVKIQKPLNSSSVNASDVQCIVAKEGSHTFDNGYSFEAGKVLSEDTSGNSADGWNGTGEDISASVGNHGSAPVVLGQVMSYNDSKFSTFWTYNCSDKGTPPTSSNGELCVGKHIGQTGERSDIRAEEKLGYIVIEGDTDNDGTADANGTVGTVSYRVALGGNSIDGVDNGGGASYTFSSSYAMGVATQNAMNGVNGGWAVLYGSNPFSGNALGLAIDEDTLVDTERAHCSEQVAYWVFTQDVNLSWMEVQSISSVSSGWTTVNFDNNYTDPVAVCTYHLPSSADNEAVVRLRNVGTTSMQVRIQRPRNSTSVTVSDVDCIVMEEGTHTFDNRTVEAHTVQSDETNDATDWVNSLMENVGYDNNYSIPVVLGQVMSYNDANFSVFWTSNGTHGDPPNSSNLYVGKHIGEDNTTTEYRKDETLGYIIGAANDGEENSVYYALARGADSIRGVENSPPYSYSFSSLSHTTYGYGVVTQNAMDGGDGGWAVLYGNTPIGTQINLAIDEEAVSDAERWHTHEQVSYWVFDPYPRVSLSKTSCVVDDPVNSSTNPKRIPGATIRYAIQVENKGWRDAESVRVEDNLSSYFNTTVSNIHVEDGACDCANESSSGSPDSDLNIVLDFGTVNKGSETTPTQECGYFEVDIK